MAWSGGEKAGFFPSISRWGYRRPHVTRPFSVDCCRMEDLPTRPRLRKQNSVEQQHDSGLTWTTCDKAWRDGCPDNLKHERSGHTPVNSDRFIPPRTGFRCSAFLGAFPVKVYHLLVVGFISLEDVWTSGYNNAGDRVWNLSWRFPSDDARCC